MLLAYHQKGPPLDCVCGIKNWRSFLSRVPDGVCLPGGEVLVQLTGLVAPSWPLIGRGALADRLTPLVPTAGDGACDDSRSTNSAGGGASCPCR